MFRFGKKAFLPAQGKRKGFSVVVDPIVFCLPEFVKRFNPNKKKLSAVSTNVQGGEL